MPLTESRNAIGVLMRHLAQQLAARTDAVTVEIGRPEQAANGGESGPKLNLFVYAMQHDAHMRNTVLDRGQEPPIWLCLRCLMTAFDPSQNSDSDLALELLGQGMLALREIETQRPIQPELADNPEAIKIAFDQSEPELLSTIMQGTDERYRLSAAFDIRPVMLTTVTGTSGAPLIRSVGDPADPGVLVLPSLGPRLNSVEPTSFVLGDTITLNGGDLAADAVEVLFGDVAVPVPPADRTNRSVRIQVPAPPVADIPAGSQAIAVVRTLPNGRRQSSNCVLGRLHPVVATTTPGALTSDGANLFGDLSITGNRLGGTDDQIFVGFLSAGTLVLLLEVPGSVSQTSLTVSVPELQALPPGPYRIVVRVNGEQAMDAPEVSWT